MNDDQFQSLLNSGLPLTIYPSKKRLLRLALLAAFLVTCSIAMIHQHNDQFMLISGWAGAVFFGAGLLVILTKMLLPESQALMLDKEGFIINYSWRKQRWSWKSVSEFVAKEVLTPEAIKTIDIMVGVAAMVEGMPARTPLSARKPRGNNMVYFDDGSTGKKAALSRYLTGYNCALPVSSYELSAGQMVELMNHYRSVALQQSTAR